MRKIVFAIIWILIPMVMNAQGLFKKLDKMNREAEAKEDKAGVFSGSDYVIAGDGKIVLPDGTEEAGTVKFIVMMRLDSMKYFWFTPASEMKPKKMRNKDVKCFVVNNRAFYPVRTKDDDLNIGNDLIFMEMLNNSEQDKFKMYLFRKVEAVPKQFSQTKPYELKTDYYVVLPDFKNAHNMEDLTFTPFAKKMSDYLKDCPELSDKIKNKEDGYKYNMMNLNGNDEVFLRIMKEYNSCGK